MYRKTLTLIAALALVPAAVAAQSGQGEARGQNEAAARGADPDARIQAALRAAAEARIPTSLLESKIREGEAKGVAREQVAAAVEERLEALVRARGVLDGAQVRGATDGELLVAAEALRAGVSEEALVRVSSEAPTERRAVATAVLTDLVRLGYGSADALARVDAALRRGPEALVNLRAEAAASLRARGLLSTDVTGGVRGGGSIR